MPQSSKTTVDRFAYIALAVSVALLVTVCFASLEMSKKTTFEAFQERKVKKGAANTSIPLSKITRESPQEFKYQDSLKTIQSLDHTLDLLTTRLETQKEERERVEKHYQDQLRAQKLAYIQEQENALILRAKLEETDTILNAALNSERAQILNLQEKIDRLVLMQQEQNLVQQAEYQHQVKAIDTLRQQLEEKEELLTFAADREKIEHQNFDTALYEKIHALDELTAALNTVSQKAVTYEKELVEFKQKAQELELALKTEEMRAQEMTDALEKAFIEYSRELDKIATLEKSLKDVQAEFSSTTHVLNVALADESNEKEELTQKLWTTQNSLSMADLQVHEQEKLLEQKSASLEALNASLNKASSEKEALKQYVTTLENDMSVAVTQLSEQETLLLQNKQTLETLSASLNESVSDRENLKQYVTALETDTKMNRIKIQEQETLLEKNNHDLKMLSASLGQLTAERDDLKTQASSLETYISATAVQIQTKETEIETLRASLNQTNAEKEAFKNHVAELQSAISVATVQIEEQEKLLQKRGATFETLVAQEEMARNQLARVFHEKEQELETIAHTLNSALAESSDEKNSLKEYVATLERNLVTADFQIKEQQELFAKAAQEAQAKVQKLALGLLKQKDLLKKNALAHEEQKTRIEKYSKALEKTQHQLKSEQEKEALLEKELMLSLTNKKELEERLAQASFAYETEKEAALSSMKSVLDNTTSVYQQEQKAVLELNEKLTARLEKYSKALEMTKEQLKADQERQTLLAKELEETRRTVQVLEKELLQTKLNRETQKQERLDETTSLLEETTTAYKEELQRNESLEEEVNKLRGALTTLESKLGVMLSATLEE